MEDYKEKLRELLVITAKQNASDLHIAVGRRPTIRVDGVLVPIQKEPITTPEIAEGVIEKSVQNQNLMPLKIILADLKILLFLILNGNIFLIVLTIKYKSLSFSSPHSASHS